MPETRSPFPEFIELVVQAADALTGVRKSPDSPMTHQQCELVRSMIDFVNDHPMEINADLASRVV